MNLKYEEKRPTAKEYNTLMELVGWGNWSDNIIEEALDNTIYSICVYDGEKIVGYGRLIGDKTIFMYIHSFMVHPEYQGQGIGKGIIKKLLEYIDELKKVNPKIRTYLGAAKGKESFYEQFGFVARPTEDVGAGMILKETKKITGE